MKIIYSAKPYKDGYRITSYTWNEKTQRYTDIKTIQLTADKESADIILKGIESIEKQTNPNIKTSWQNTKKWTFLIIDF